MESEETSSRTMEKDQLKASNLPPKVWNSEMMVSVTGEPPGTIEGEEETAQVKEMEIIPEYVGPPLSLLDVLRITAILEDATDQLSILNYIMPVQYERSQGTSSKKSREANLEGKSVEKSQVISATSKTSSPYFPMKGPKFPEISQGGQFVVDSNKMQDLVFNKPTRQTIMTVETLKKIQIDRRETAWYIMKSNGLEIRKLDHVALALSQTSYVTSDGAFNLPELKLLITEMQFFSDVITHTMQELEDSGTFTVLLQTLGKEREDKMHFYDIIASEEKGRKQIKFLQKQLLNVKKERQVEVQSRNEYIAHLKDQLQEMKAKTNMESRYMKKNTELQIAQAYKKCNKAEELLLEEIEKLRMKTEEENRIHTEIETFLKKEQQKLEEKLEFWMEKYDKDTEMKQNELNALKAAKASDLAHLQDLAKLIREYEQVIIEDRVEKEKTRKKLEQDDLELRSALKLQAWWRGTVIRNEIGSFKMPKKEKDDSKDSKGKGKDKEKRRGKK